MKKTILPFLLLATKLAFSQTNVYTARDGTKITVTVHDANPDHCDKMSAYAGFYGMEGSRFAGLNYYMPKVFYLNVQAGQSNYMAEMDILAINMLKENEVPHIARMLQAAGRKKRYIVRIPEKVRFSIGPHIGIGYTDFSMPLNEINGTGNTPYTTTYAIGGISLLKARHTDFTIDERRRYNLHVVARLNADIVYYFNRTLKDKDPSDTRTLNDITRQTGFRLYYEGRNTFYSRKGGLGFFYMGGAGLNSYKGYSYSLFGGLGIFYAFL